MNLHMELIWKYEIFDGGDVFLGEKSKTKIIGNEKFELNLMGGSIKIFHGVMHILGFSKNLIYISNMNDAGVNVMFEKYTCNMVQGVMKL